MRSLEIPLRNINLCPMVFQKRLLGQVRASLKKCPGSSNDHERYRCGASAGRFTVARANSHRTAMQEMPGGNEIIAILLSSLGC